MNGSGGVLIVSASTGTGHARAADALVEAFARRSPDLHVRHEDLLLLAPRWVRAVYGGGYELMATRAPWLWREVYRWTDASDGDRARWGAAAERILTDSRRFLDEARSAFHDAVIALEPVPHHPGSFRCRINGQTTHALFYVEDVAGRALHGDLAIVRAEIEKRIRRSRWCR